MAQSPEVQARIGILRQKAREGTLTLEESREAVRFLREDRVLAQATSTKSRTTKAAKAAAVNSDDLLSELD